MRFSLVWKNPSPLSRGGVLRSALPFSALSFDIARAIQREAAPSRLNTAR